MSAEQGSGGKPREVASMVRRASFVVVIACWTIQVSALSFFRYFAVPDEKLADMLPPRLIVTGAGILLSLLLVEINQWTQGQRTWTRLLITALATLVCCVSHAVINSTVFQSFFPGGTVWADMALLDYIIAATQWLWVYLALAAMLMALSFALDLRERERHMAELRAVAHAAQMRALRYQINPHFLFNTLNSIAALIGQKRNQTAETMVEQLSDFLRSGLALDPFDDIPLGREIELQSRYLEIEAQRFPERLKVEIDVPANLHDALVPSLIIQPMVENAIKYAVARSTRVVTLRIAAYAEDGRLHLRISDDGGDAPRINEPGTGVGLANVAARLRGRFGQDGSFEAGPGADGGFEAHVAFPLNRPG